MGATEHSPVFKCDAKLLGLTCHSHRESKAQRKPGALSQACWWQCWALG